jgi:predicted RNA-binding protein with PUA-like domain
MNYWLFKTEPESFSVADLARAAQRTAAWDGVRNYQARNLLRDTIQVGDAVFIYHSSCEVPGIAGLARVVKAGYPDHTAFDRKHHHYDAGSKRDAPRWYMVDVKLERKLKRVITLEELNRHAARALAGMQLLKRGNRLSVLPVEAAHWRFILSLE